MGIYLPTQSFILPEEDIPSPIPKDFFSITSLLEEHYANREIYQCITKGYGHTVAFQEIARAAIGKSIGELEPDLGFASNTRTVTLHGLLGDIEDQLLNKTAEVIDNLIAEKAFPFYPEQSRNSPTTPSTREILTELIPQFFQHLPYALGVYLAAHAKRWWCFCPRAAPVVIIVSPATAGLSPPPTRGC